MSLQARIESAITQATGEPAHFSDSRTSYGGSINDSRVVSLSDGRQFFIKTHAAAAKYPGMFALEFEALKLLTAANVIRVPQAIACDDDFIVMEAYNEGGRKNDWPERMGRQLAQLHLATQTNRYGFERDNYIGTTLQVNTWTDNWLDFWREQRLGHQLKLFANKTSSDDRLLKLGERLMTKLDEFLGEIDEDAVLLHGDLWSGNAAADEKGEPIIYDPASYYGHREAEIGMMRMFGGFGPRCEAAYEEVWPFVAGAEQRISLYRLYHELNHLNLFGRSYYQSCISTMESLL
jgi:protein-ribulosamine 3-kinase